jgi:hypothetical protein
MIFGKFYVWSIRKTKAARAEPIKGPTTGTQL